MTAAVGQLTRGTLHRAARRIRLLALAAALGATVLCAGAGASAPSLPGLYWANDTTHTIGSANLDGTGPDQSLIAATADRLASDGQHIYWADRANNRIGLANLNGTIIDASFIPGADQPTGV